MTIKHHKFEGSSMLLNCAYNTEDKELTVTFTNGKEYPYKDVDASIYDGLVDAQSAGKFFNSVKNQLVQK